MEDSCRLVFIGIKEDKCRNLVGLSFLLVVVGVFFVLGMEFSFFKFY